MPLESNYSASTSSGVEIQVSSIAYNLFAYNRMVVEAFKMPNRPTYNTVRSLDSNGLAAQIHVQLLHAMSLYLLISGRQVCKGR